MKFVDQNRNYLKYFILICALILISNIIWGLNLGIITKKRTTFNLKIANKDDLISLINMNFNISTSHKPRGSFIEKYPNVNQCKKGGLKKWSINNLYNNQQQFNYSKKASKETHNHRYIRGVSVYLPVENFDDYIPEFRWLYRSWIEMQRYEPVKWRTDLVVFIERSDFNVLKELNCTFENRRTNILDKPMCTLIKYVPLKDRTIPRLNNSIFKDDNKAIDANSKISEKYEYLLNKVDIFSDDELNLLPFLTLVKKSLKSYVYLDSVLIAFEGYSYFKSAGFDFIIRSDMDVFLTPLFSTWLPKHCNDFVVGGGAYNNDFNINRLKRIANHLNFKSAGQWNLGSTWYSTPDQFRLISYLSLFCMVFLNREEFTIPEKQGKLETLLWPDWHYQVVLLYGQYLALNHLISTKEINVPRLNEFIDYPSDSTDKIHEKIHIHVYHTDDLFSKFAFKLGKYDKLEIPHKNLHEIQNYCLKMALESKRQNCSYLHKQLLVESKRKI